MIPPQPPRRFTIVDAMALVLISTLLVAGVLSYPYLFLPIPGGSYRYHPILTDAGAATIRYEMSLWYSAIAPGLAAAMVILLALRFRRPRPRRLFRLPGTLACLAVIVTAAVRFGGFLVRRTYKYARGAPWHGGWPDRPTPMSHYFWFDVPYFANCAGGAVVAAWLVAILSGWWRKPADWVERAGRVLGLLWVLMKLYDTWVQKTY